MNNKKEFRVDPSTSVRVGVTATHKKCKSFC